MAPAQPILTQLLVQDGVKEVPKRFIQPLKQASAPPAHTLPESLPVIDLAGLHGNDRNHTLAKIHKACQQWGFFQIVNHGIPSYLIQRVKDVSRRFFDLPLEEKQNCAMKPGEILGYGRHHAHREDVVFDWVDCLLHYAYPLSLRDVKNTWPAKPLDYVEVMDAYAKEIKKLALLLLNVFCENLGLPPSYLERAFGEFTLPIRVNYYPPCPQPDLVLGQGAHSDLGCLSFILQDDVSGLQVKKDDNWVVVDPVTDAVVVNVADMMQVITNQRYISAEHRVVVNDVKERMSIVAFYTPSDDVPISPISSLVDSSHPQVYRPTTYGAYVALYKEKRPDPGKSFLQSLLLSDMVVGFA